MLDPRQVEEPLSVLGRRRSGELVPRGHHREPIEPGDVEVVEATEPHQVGIDGGVITTRKVRPERGTPKSADSIEASGWGNAPGEAVL